jgi:hypothetical protein
VGKYLDRSTTSDSALCIAIACKNLDRSTTSDSALCIAGGQLPSAPPRPRRRRAHGARRERRPRARAKGRHVLPRSVGLDLPCNCGHAPSRTCSCGGERRGDPRVRHESLERAVAQGGAQLDADVGHRCNSGRREGRHVLRRGPREVARQALSVVARSVGHRGVVPIKKRKDAPQPRGPILAGGAAPARRAGWWSAPPPPPQGRRWWRRPARWSRRGSSRRGRR